MYLPAEHGHKVAKVYSSLNATGFYEKQGFRAVDEQAFECCPGVILNVVTMEKELNPR